MSKKNNDFTFSHTLDLSPYKNFEDEFGVNLDRIHNDNEAWLKFINDVLQKHNLNVKAIHVEWPSLIGSYPEDMHDIWYTGKLSELYKLQEFLDREMCRRSRSQYDNTYFLVQHSDSDDPGSQNIKRVSKGKGHNYGYGARYWAAGKTLLEMRQVVWDESKRDNTYAHMTVPRPS